MRTILIPTLAAGLLLGAADRVRADEQPRDTIVRAIKALGGMEKLALDRAVHRKIKGLLLNGADYSYTGEIYSHGASRSRLVLHLDMGGRSMRVIQVSTADKIWMRTNESTQEVQGNVRERMKQSRHVDRVTSLIPLLQDKGFTLSMLPASLVEDRPAVGVKAAYKGMQDVLLYFDKADGLPVKYEYKAVVDAFNMQLTSMAVVYKDYKTVDTNPGAEDERLLKEARLAVDNPALLAYLRKQTLTPAVRQEIEQLIRGLGAESFRIRRKSAASLIARGATALPFLQKALKDPDPEIAQRAKECLQKFKPDEAAPLMSAAARLLGFRNPCGAVETLLDFLPSAPDAAVAGAVKAALFEIATRSKSPDKALLKALESKNAERRAAAAAALGRDGGAYRNQPGRRCYIPGLKVAHTNVYYQDGKKSMEFVTVENRFYNKLDDSLFAKP